MKLKKVRVTKYKCVVDSTPWKVDQVTTLVGKNEAGNPQYLRRYISSTLWMTTHRIFIQMTIHAGMH